MALEDSMGSELRRLLDSVATDASGATYRSLSSGYRDQRGTPEGAALGRTEVAAYAVARAPATHAAAVAVLTELRDRRPELAPRSLLDVGAGLGTASWAAVAAFPSIDTVAMLERAAGMVELGRQLAGASSSPALQSAPWHTGDVGDLGDRRADLVLSSYVLSELDGDRLERVVGTWWDAAAAHLVIVDTGTPAGFAAVKRARAALVALGATLTAPCPNDGACPMTESDWCHFSARLARSSQHRRVKSGSLGYEDEKFSYVIASRAAPAHAEGRVVRHPQVRTGHVRLRVCHAEQIVEVVVSKRTREAYRWARDARWGDAVPAAVLDGGP